MPRTVRICGRAGSGRCSLWLSGSGDQQVFLGAVAESQNAPCSNGVPHWGRWNHSRNGAGRGHSRSVAGASATMKCVRKLLTIGLMVYSRHLLSWRHSSMPCPFFRSARTKARSRWRANPVDLRDCARCCRVEWGSPTSQLGEWKGRMGLYKRSRNPGDAHSPDVKAFIATTPFEAPNR